MSVLLSVVSSVYANLTIIKGFSGSEVNSKAYNIDGTI